MNPVKKPKFIFIIVAVIVVIIGAVALVIIRRGGANNSAGTSPTPTVQEQVIPTIDSSVLVVLTQITQGKEVLLQIKNVPTGTQTIDYELSYQTKQQGLQGLIGTIQVAGKNEFEKQLTLGTCSSGTCVYHEVVGSIKLGLKFTGDYGEKVFDKEFSL